MQCYTDLIPPSGVTHALALPFTHANAANLIVARTSVLQIFRSVPVGREQESRLVLVAEYRLAGTITALSPVKALNTKSGGDALLVAFRDAKLSLVEWDPLQHSIATISIHYYEGDDLLKCPWGPDLRDCPSRLTVDPNSRCAAFNFGVGNLAIIPFHQPGDDLALDDDDDEMHVDDGPDGPLTRATNGDASTHATPYATSFVLPLARIEPTLLHPIDVAFLHEYREPTFGILYSTAARSSNMATERKDVTIYAVFALDLDQKASTTLLSIHRLPNDLFKVVPLPRPVGGALLVGANELIHVDQGGKTTAIGVNELARQASAFSMADLSDRQMRLEGCQVSDMGRGTGDVLVALSSGEMARLAFRLDGRSVSGLSIQRIPQDLISHSVKGRISCIVPLDAERIFLGSEEGDSVVVGPVKSTTHLRRKSSRPQVEPNGVPHEAEADEDEELDPDEEQDDLYAEVLAQSANGYAADTSLASTVNFRLLDTLPCVAPFKDVALGRPAKRKREDDDDGVSRDAELELAVASGQGRAGGIALFSRKITPQTIRASKHAEIAGVWSFPVKRRKQSLAGSDFSTLFDDHVILSKKAGTPSATSSLFSLVNGDLRPRLDTEFDSSAGATVAVGCLSATGHIVQVLATEVRVYDASKCLGGPLVPLPG